jgi:hypothetical protein
MHRLDFLTLAGAVGTPEPIVQRLHTMSGVCKMSSTRRSSPAPP